MLGFATAKERKGFVKGLKQHCVAFATNAVDCVLLLRLLLTVDDTKLLSEQILKARLHTRDRGFNIFADSLISTSTAHKCFCTYSDDVVICR